MATAVWYGPALLGQFSGTAARRVDWVNDTIKATLHTSSYAPDQDNHTFFSSATNELTTTGGYTVGGKTLATKSVSYDVSTNQVRLIAADLVWTALSATFRYLVIWKDTGTASTSPLLGFADLGAQTTSAVDFSVDFDQTGGLLYIAAA